MEQVLSILFLISCISGLIYLSVRDYRKLNAFHARGINRLRGFVGEDDDGITYYRACGELWVETSREDLEKSLRSTCKTQITTRCAIFHEAKFCVNYDEKNNSVQVVLGSEEYDFSKNNYYKVWVKGNKEFNDRVNKAMGRS